MVANDSDVRPRIPPQQGYRSLITGIPIRPKGTCPKRSEWRRDEATILSRPQVRPGEQIKVAVQSCAKEGVLRMGRNSYDD